MRHDPHLSKLAKEPFVRIHPDEGSKRGLKDGNEAGLTAGNNSIQIKVKWDKQVAMNTVVLPLGFEQKCSVHQLEVNLLNGFPVALKPLI